MDVLRILGVEVKFVLVVFYKDLNNYVKMLGRLVLEMENVIWVN